MPLSAAALDTRFLAACAIARDAGVRAHKRFLDRSSFTIGFKGPQDFITEVDKETERRIHGALMAAFPDDGFIGEEGAAAEPGPGQPVWVVDPIDGTANFARGLPHYCVSIALVADRVIEAGVIYDPALDELFAARRGAGAFVNGGRLKTAETASFAAASIEVGWNMRSGVDRFVALAGRVAATGAGVRRSGSGALGLAYVAAGRTDGYVEHHINSWDCLAGIALVTEAGGYASDFLAGEGLRKGNPLLACALGIRDALIGIAQLEGVG